MAVRRPLVIKNGKIRELETGDTIASFPTVVQVTGDYTLQLSDAQCEIEALGGSASNITVPANASVAIPVGTDIPVWQYGAGQVTFVADTGVTIRSRGDAYKIAGRYGVAWLRKRGTNEWYLTGDLTT